VIKGKPVSTFFNWVLDWFIGLNVEFVSAILFIVLTFYMMLSGFKGNLKFGL